MTFATVISGKIPGLARGLFCSLNSVVATVLILTVWTANAHADAPNPLAAKLAEKNFSAAKAKLESNTNDPAALWQFARATFDWADVQTNDSRRREIADQGLAAAQRLIAQDPKSVEGHYYLGMNMGEVAQTETLGALKLVRQMEVEFATAEKANAGFDYAGPDRNLGLLYRDAPGWPTSIGNRTKAREHLQRAMLTAPDYPDNVLNLIESELKWGDTAGAKRDLKTLEDIWPKAQKQFTGEDWEASWADWTKRREDVRKKVGSATNVSTSPHNKE